MPLYDAFILARKSVSACVKITRQFLATIILKKHTQSSKRNSSQQRKLMKIKTENEVKFYTKHESFIVNCLLATCTSEIHYLWLK